MLYSPPSAENITKKSKNCAEYNYKTKYILVKLISVDQFCCLYPERKSSISLAAVLSVSSLGR